MKIEHNFDENNGTVDLLIKGLSANNYDKIRILLKTVVDYNFDEEDRKVLSEQLSLKQLIENISCKKCQK